MENSNLTTAEIGQLEIKIKKVREYKIYLFLKRTFDIISATVALMLTSPIMAIVGILVAIESRGPVVFGHTRIGKDKRPIKIYKFRTMFENSQEIFNNFTEAQKEEFYINFKLDNDPRVTKVGAFLRRTSLDELPQLVNIIKGDMSVVGPRPIVKKEVEKYGEYADKLFSVIPGLTGYWQANGRSDTTYEERINMDMLYIDNKSFLMDMKIIFKTIISVVKKEGAF